MIERKFQRVRHPIPATVQLTYGPGHTNSYPGELIDLSISGLRVLVPASVIEPLRPGARARIYVLKEQGLGSSEAPGSIVRSAPNPDTSRQIAITFDRVWYDIVASLSRRKSVIIEINPFGVRRPEEETPDEGSMTRVQSGRVTMIGTAWAAGSKIGSITRLKRDDGTG